MKYIVTVLLFVLATSLLCMYYSLSGVSCVVSNAGEPTVNRFYEARDGSYWRVNVQWSKVPDVFSFFRAQTMSQDNGSPSLILFTKGLWVMYGSSTSGEKRALYVNDCAKAASPSACVNSPPSTGWEVTGNSKLPVPDVSFQSGSLADAFDSHSSSSNSNLAKLWNQPVTTLLLLMIFAVAYYLWAYRIDVSSISYSYDAVVIRGEYWRMVTASMSHVDAWHLLFNTMSLYELGALESIYGSLTY
eukprot:gene20452-24406_t